MNKAILIGLLVYLGMHFGDQGLHFIYFYLTHDFASSNLLMIKSSFLLNFAPLMGGAVVGYLSQKGVLNGFLVGALAGLIILGIRQYNGANPFFQEFTPAILFDEVFLRACICAAGGAVGETLKRR
jgi:hypothetical protein|tara:strand:- start:1868 stop:2245 length:378 start_codon:yes stop_codon:yes gene_type:complete